MGSHWKRARLIGGGLLLFLLLLAPRLYGITHSPFESGDLWRQPDTEAIALLFLRQGFNPLRPQFFYDGPFPNVVALELQVTTTLIAALYQLFGRHFLLARLVPVAFFLGSAGFLYGIARRYLTPWGAALSVLLYGLFPVNLYLSRSIQPEAAGLFFYIGALYLFLRFVETDRDRWLILSALFTALAITQKPQTALIGLPMLGAAWARYGWRWTLQPRLYLFALGALGLPALYYAYSNAVAEFHFVSGIATKHIFTRFYSDILTPEAREFFRLHLPKAFTGTGLVVIGAGLLWVRRGFTLIYLWVLASVINLVAVVAVIKFYYYLVYLTPPLAVVGGALLARIRWRLVPAAIVAAVGVTGFLWIRTMYEGWPALETQGRIVRELTSPDELIVIGTRDPALLNMAERAGWRFGLALYPGVPREPVAELEYYVSRGARYFVPMQGYIYGDDAGRLRAHLEATYQRVEPVPGFPVYRLSR